MTVDKIKRKLNGVATLKVRLLALKQKIEEITYDLEGVGAINLGGTKIKPTQENFIEGRYIKYLDRLKTLQNEYNLVFSNLCQEEDELNERMMRLNPTEHDVIYIRYLKGIKSIPIMRVADKFGYTYESIQKIQQRAFKKMADE